MTSLKEFLEKYEKYELLRIFKTRDRLSEVNNDCEELCSQNLTLDRLLNISERLRITEDEKYDFFCIRDWFHNFNTSIGFFFDIKHNLLPKIAFENIETNPINYDDIRNNIINTFHGKNMNCSITLEQLLNIINAIEKRYPNFDFL